MEIRARYILVGLFVLAVLVGGAAFLFWLWGVNGFGDRTTYAVRFTGPVSGLSVGSQVLFNGIAVGEVTGLSLDPAKPSDVVVTVTVAKSAPVRSDTRAALAFSGLTGAARINLVGGAAGAAPAAAGNPPAITADSASLADLTESARGALSAIDKVVADNADALHNAISSIDTFSAALARNSDKVDAIISGLSQLTGGGSTDKYALHDLPAPTPPKPAALPQGQLVVNRPASVVALATQRILLAGPVGDAPVFDDVRWADSLPIVIQERVIETFENAGDVKVISDAGLAMGAFQLALDIRAFHMTAPPDAAAEVTIAAKLLDNSGMVLDGKTFTARTPLTRTDESAAAIAAFSAAFAKVSSDLTLWTLSAMTTAEANAPTTPPDLAPPAPAQPAPKGP